MLPAGICIRRLSLTLRKEGERLCRPEKGTTLLWPSADQCVAVAGGCQCIPGGYGFYSGSLLKPTCTEVAEARDLQSVAFKRMSNVSVHAHSSGDFWLQLNATCFNSLVREFEG